MKAEQARLRHEEQEDAKLQAIRGETDDDKPFGRAEKPRASVAAQRQT